MKFRISFAVGLFSFAVGLMGDWPWIIVGVIVNLMRIGLIVVMIEVASGFVISFLLVVLQFTPDAFA